MCCFSTKNVVLRNKNKDGLARNKDSVVITIDRASYDVDDVDVKHVTIQWEDDEVHYVLNQHA
jgi:hypothetical protein